jgi:hypothetical protein
MYIDTWRVREENVLCYKAYELTIFFEFNDSETLGSNDTPKASDLLTENHEARKRMVYHNFSVSHRLLAAQGWCSFADFTRFVADHQFLGFHTVANRNQICEAYVKLRGPAPFSSTARFPDDFFLLLGGPLRSYFEQLLCAIDLPDRAFERSNVGPKRGITRTTDTKRSFDVAFQRLATVAVECNVAKLRNQGVYCRETFESAFELKWLDIQ